MSGVLRSLPDLAPREVSRVIGTPRKVLASAPCVASNRSACLRAHSSVLGAYSPVSGMLLPSIVVLPILAARGGAVRRPPGRAHPVGSGLVCGCAPHARTATLRDRA